MTFPKSKTGVVVASLYFISILFLYYEVLCPLAASCRYTCVLLSSSPIPFSVLIFAGMNHGTGISNQAAYTVYLVSALLNVALVYFLGAALGKFCTALFAGQLTETKKHRHALGIFIVGIVFLGLYAYYVARLLYSFFFGL